MPFVWPDNCMLYRFPGARPELDVYAFFRSDVASVRFILLVFLRHSGFTRVSRIRDQRLDSHEFLYVEFEYFAPRLSL